MWGLRRGQEQGSAYCSPEAKSVSAFVWPASSERFAYFEMAEGGETVKE